MRHQIFIHEMRPRRAARAPRLSKQIDDAEPAIDAEAVLHVFGPQNTAIGAQRSGED
jgi:hypothetical protein